MGGMKVHMLGGVQFSDQMLQELKAGSSHYTVTFKKQEKNEEPEPKASVPEPVVDTEKVEKPAVEGRKPFVARIIKMDVGAEMNCQCHRGNPEAKLGAHVKHYPETTPPYLKVHQICEGLAIHRYNQTKAATPNEIIMIGDRIMKVNGKSGTDKELVEYLYSCGLEASLDVVPE